MIEFLNIQSAFEHYKRVLGGNDPVETRAKYHDDRLYVEHYHLIRASLLSERLSKREPAAIRIFSLACCLDHHDASATQLTGKISRVRPRKHDDQVDFDRAVPGLVQAPVPEPRDLRVLPPARAGGRAASQSAARPPNPAPGSPWNGLLAKPNGLNSGVSGPFK